MAAIDELKSLLNEDLRQLSLLADLLSTEKGVLASAQAAELQQLTDQKNQILDGIRERAKQKIHALVAMGFRPGSGEPSTFIRAGGFEDLFQLWKQADAQLRQCQSLNQQNGRVVGHLQKRLTRLTDIFRGASSQPKLYGAKGEQTSVSSRNVLASA